MTISNDRIQSFEITLLDTGIELGTWDVPQAPFINQVILGDLLVAKIIELNSELKTATVEIQYIIPVEEIVNDDSLEAIETELDALSAYATESLDEISSMFDKADQIAQDCLEKYPLL